MNWLPATVGDACIPTSQTDPTRSGAPTFRYVDIASVDRDAKAISRADELPCAEAPSRARKIIHTSDVLVSTVRPNLNAVALVPDELDGEVASTGFAVLRADLKLLHPKFLFYWVQHREFIDFLVANATGASYPAVTEGVVKRTRLPLATPTEQSRIVELLDEADRLRHLRRAADAKAARIMPALFLTMFGDPATNPLRLPTKSLGDLDICEINPRSRLSLPDDAVISFVPMADVDEYLGKITGSQTRLYGEVKKGFTPFQNGDVLFAKITPCMQNGKAAIASGLVGGVGFGSTEFHVLRAAKVVTAEYLFALVRLQSFRNHAMSAFTGSAGQQRVPGEFLKQYRLPIPSPDGIQKFSKILRLLMSSQFAAEQTAKKLDTQFGVILQHAFSGRLTAKWREAHMKELLAEMEEQARALNLPRHFASEAFV